MNLTNESLTFTPIQGPVPNRGLLQDDIALFGLHYLHQVSDAGGAGALHLEPGLWMSVPATTDPANPASLVRMASIPHGNTLLAQGPNPGPVGHPGPPNIGVLSLGAGQQGIETFSYPDDTQGSFSGANGLPEQTLANDVPNHQPPTNSNGPYSPPITQALVDDPNSMLRAAIKGQNIINTIEINITTDSTGGAVANIPFLGTKDLITVDVPNHTGDVNAFVFKVTATYWIETVALPIFTGPIVNVPLAGAAAAGNLASPRDIEELFSTFLQLQISQVVWLTFDGVVWPHISVATLVLGAG